MSITVEAIYEAGVLKPLAPLRELPEHTKVRITIEALPVTVPHASVIDEQRRHRIPLDATVARDLGDRHEYDLFES
jgi:predicted DNA-binding antitoxin AbrB/MazE fold protein